MADIAIIDRQVAQRSQRETTAGDVHLLITDRESLSPRRAWWITEAALAEALAAGETLDSLDRLVRSAPRIRDTSVEYPIRAYYLPLLRENIERQQRGENVYSLWRWRTFSPTRHSTRSAICRYDTERKAWINHEQRPMFNSHEFNFHPDRRPARETR